jgi:transposase
LERLALPTDAHERIEIALAMIDAIEVQLTPLERELRQLARRQAGCRALMGLYGMGELTSLVTLCELGDVQRLSASRKAVRMAGIDIGVHRSDRRARVGKLTRQGSPQLRWALYEAALSACRPGLRRLSGAQSARAQPHARIADDRAQARPPVLPRAERARPCCLGAGHRLSHRPALRHAQPFFDDHPSGQRPQLSRFAPSGGGPPKIERPESLRPD